MIRFSAG